MISILYVDDIRVPIKNDNNKFYYIVRDYNTAIKALNEKTFDIVDLDHDLGEDKTGYDIAKYIVENQIALKGFYVHSMNVVGKHNIVQLLTHYGYKEIFDNF